MKVMFGGTFDPVHNGHLRMAVELSEALCVTEVALVPCYQAVHKSGVGASAEARLEMVQLATREDDLLIVDAREVRRKSPSYTVETLRELRAESPSRPLVLAVGNDAAADMPRWRDFRDYAGLCHVVIIARPGFHTSAGMKALTSQGFEQVDSAAALHSKACGLVLDLRLNLLEISSSDIRERIRAGKSIRYLVEGAVREFICDNGLYQPNLEGE